MTIPDKAYTDTTARPRLYERDLRTEGVFHAIGKGVAGAGAIGAIAGGLIPSPSDTFLRDACRPTRGSLASDAGACTVQMPDVYRATLGAGHPGLGVEFASAMVVVMGLAMANNYAHDLRERLFGSRRARGRAPPSE